MTEMSKQHSASSRRSVLVGAAATLGGLVAAACGPLRPAAPPGDKTAEIRLSVWGDIQDWDVYAAMTSDFNAAQQRVNVTPEQYKGFNYYEKVQTLLASGESPDIIYFQGWEWQSYAAQNSAQPLDKLLARDRAMQRLIPPSYENQSKYRGKAYMLTADTGPWVIMYNKSIFDRFGVAYPREGWTYDQWFDLVRRLTRRDGDTQYYGFTTRTDYKYNVPWMRINGGMEWDRIVEPRQAKWDSAPIVKELQLQLYDLPQRYKFAPGAPDTPSNTRIDYGNVAMMMQGPWYLPRMWGPQATVQGGLPYDVVSMPKGTVWRPLHEQNGHTMSAQTKQPEAAWEFLKWVAGDQGQQRIAEGGRMGNLPETNEKIWAPIAMPKYNFKNLAAWLNTQRNGEIHIAGITQAQVWDAGLKQGFDDIAKGRKGAKEALTAIQPQMQALLDAYWAKEKR